MPYINRKLKHGKTIFDKPFAPLIIAEVEFPTLEEAKSFTPPEWFAKDVTGDYHYSNSYLSQKK